MFTFVLILLVVVCIALVGIVLIQNPKGGGLVSEFSTANQIIGVQKSTDGVEKVTWGLASTLFVLCLVSTLMGTSQQNESAPQKESLIKDKVIELPSAPQAPMNQAPQENGGGQQPMPEQQQTPPTK